VNRFQGQQAPIVIYSMATSAPEDAPRGMEFLHRLNRLNVATSRAQCACILVASPRLFAPECKTDATRQCAVPLHRDSYFNIRCREICPTCFANLGSAWACIVFSREAGIYFGYQSATCTVSISAKELLGTCRRRMPAARSRSASTTPEGGRRRLCSTASDQSAARMSALARYICDLRHNPKWWRLICTQLRIYPEPQPIFQDNCGAPESVTVRN